jgi:hypothetical protein
MQYAMFLIMKEIRGRSIGDLVAILKQKLKDEGGDFTESPEFYLHGINGRQIHRVLARMSDYVEVQSGLPTKYEEYSTRSGKHGYEVEHIWSVHYEGHGDDFKDENEFKSYRNRLGGLLLLPKTFNASYGDLPYEDKLVHYFGQNLLAKSLHPKCYDHNPGFLRFVESSGLPFKPIEHFGRNELDARQNLYLKLAERIWSPAVLEEEATR